MDGSIRVIKGPDAGISCKLRPGANIIGRSAKAALILTSPDISWEHFSITRNGDQYVVENLSAMGTYLDESKISGQIKLRSRDQLRISKDTVIRFDSGGALDGGLFAGNRGLAFLASIGIAIIVALVLVVVNSRSTQPDWQAAYLQIEAWVSQDVQAGRLPPETLRLFADAWRLEQAGDYLGSRPAWLRLRLLLDHLQDNQKLAMEAPENANALKNLLNPPPGPRMEPTPDELAAAFNQFVTRRLAWSTEEAKNLKS